jgi:biopolymer transport protein ExbD
MTEKRRFIDVWIVESNTVYREVPFTVVADWIQQGRLLEDDQIKVSGTAAWNRIGESADFNAYLPKPQAFRSEDKAEALERVELDFAYKKHHVEEDDDVDMIPLIDVSLVLLIFFMLLSSGASFASSIPLPGARNPDVTRVNPGEVTVGIDLKDGQEVYTLGLGNKPSPDASLRDIPSYDELKGKILNMLTGEGTTEVTINANRDVRAGLVRQLTADLTSSPFRAKVSKVLIGVNEVQQ